MKLSKYWGLIKISLLIYISKRDFEDNNRLTIVIQSNEAVDSIEQTVSSVHLLIDTIFNKTSKEDDTVQLKAVISILDHIAVRPPNYGDILLKTRVFVGYCLQFYFYRF